MKLKKKAVLMVVLVFVVSVIGSLQLFKPKKTEAMIWDVVNTLVCCTDYAYGCGEGVFEACYMDCMKQDDCTPQE